MNLRILPAADARGFACERLQHALSKSRPLGQSPGAAGVHEQRGSDEGRVEHLGRERIGKLPVVSQISIAADCCWIGERLARPRRAFGSATPRWPDR